MTQLLTATAALVLLATPLAANAQAATFTLTGAVGEECALGAPAATLLDLERLTGDDGRLAARVTGSSVLIETQINNAWCNTPSLLSISADPLSLENEPGYASPSGFSRLITFDATLSGWPTSGVVRPLTPATSVPIPAGQAHANTLVLQISRLSTLDGAGGEDQTRFVEAGNYSAQITLTLATAN